MCLVTNYKNVVSKEMVVFLFSKNQKNVPEKQVLTLWKNQPTFFSTKGQGHRSGTPKDENKLKNTRHALPKGREELKQKPRGKNQ